MSVHTRASPRAIDAQTDSGSVHLEQTVAGDIRIATDSGSIQLRIPAGAGYDVSANTDSGGIHFKQAVAVKSSTNRHRMEGKLGAGGSKMVLKTDSGSIHVE